MFALLLLEAPACSAILGIDAIPQAGEFPLDATGSCEQLRQEQACGSVCQVFCGGEAGNTCLCPPDGATDGFFGDVFFGEFTTFEGTPPVDSPPPPRDVCTTDPKSCSQPETSPCGTMMPCDGGQPTDGSQPTDGEFFESGG
jgi:hypothetical protein